MGRSQFGRDASRRTGGSGGSGSGNVSQITSVDGSVTVNPPTGTGIVDLSVGHHDLNTTATVASAANATWNGINVTGTATVTGNTNITNTAGFNSFNYAAPVVTSAAAVTITYSATVSIAGAPTTAGSATITNPYAFWVRSGQSQFDDLIVARSPTPNNSTTTPSLRLDANGGSQCVISFRNVYPTDTYFRADSNGQMNCDPATFFNVNPNANSTRRLRVTATGVYGTELSGGDLILGSTDHATKGNVTIDSRTIIGATADITGGAFTSGLQIQGAGSGNIVLGRATANTSTTLCNVSFFNGATQAALISALGGGATDAIDLYVFTRPTGGVLTQRFLTDSRGNVVCGAAALATNATEGFFYVRACAGTPTGAPTAFTGRAPIVIDSTNNKLYFYSNAAWRDAGP